MNQSRPMYGVLSGKSPTGTREPPSATATTTIANAITFKLRRLPTTMLASDSPPDRISAPNISWRSTSTEYWWRSSGVVRYCGKWNASTPSRHRNASDSASTVAIRPWPKRSGPLRRSSSAVSATARAECGSAAGMSMTKRVEDGLGMVA